MAAAKKILKKINLTLVLALLSSLLVCPDYTVVLADSPGPGAPTLTIKPASASPGDTITIRASGFPANAVLHSVMVGDIQVPQHSIERVGDLVGNWLDIYNNGYTYTFDANGGAVFRIVLPAQAYLTASDNYVTIWTSNFEGGASPEVEAAGRFTLVLGEAGPQIDSLSAVSGAVGSYLTLSGSNFGSAAGAVYFTSTPDSLTAEVKSWSSSAVTVKVPESLTPGSTYSVSLADSAGNPSNAVSFTVTLGQYLAFVQSPPTSGWTAGIAPRTVTVAVYEPSGDIAADNSDTIQLSLSSLSQPGSAVVIGEAAAVQGVAAFSVVFAYPGAYTLSATDLTHPDVSPATGDSFTILRPTGTLVVRVNAPDPSIPDLSGSYITAWSAGLGVGSLEPLTGEGPGDYTLYLDPAADYMVSIWTRDGKNLAEETGVSAANGGTTEIALTPGETADWLLTVTDASGHALSGIAVLLTDAQTGAYINSLVTDSDGKTLRVYNLHSGRRLKATTRLTGQELYFNQEETFTLKAGENEATLVMQSMELTHGALTGRAADTDGNPVPYIPVTATEELDGRSFTYSVTTDRNGNYTLSLPAGTARLTAGSRDYELADGNLTVNILQDQQTIRDLDMVPLGTGKVYINLKTRKIGGDWQEQRVDGLLASSYRLTVTDSRGNNYGWSYPVEIRGKDGDTFQVSIDGTLNGLPSATQMVTLKDGAATASFELDQAGLIQGLVLDADGNPPLSWTGVLSRIDGSGVETYLQTISGSGGDLNIGVGEADRYSVKIYFNDGVGTAQAAIDDSHQVVNIGVISPPASGLFARQAGNSFLAQPQKTAPGGRLLLRAAYRNNSGTAVGGAALLLDIPAGAALVPGSVTLNGQPANGDISDGALQLLLGDIPPSASGVATYELQLDNAYAAPNLTAVARIRYQDQAASKTEVLGAAVVQADSVSLELPSQIGTLSTMAAGQAPPNSMVRVYCDDSLLGTAQASAGGFWKTAVTLPESGDPCSYLLQARAATPTGIMSSPPVAVAFYSRMAQLTKVEMWQGSQQPISWDPRQGVPNFYYAYNPHSPLNFKFYFDHPDRVYDLNIMSKGLEGTVQSTARPTGDGAFSASLTASDLGSLSVSYKTRSSLDDFDPAQVQLPDEAQLRVKLAPEFKDFIAENPQYDVSTNTSSLSVTFPQLNNLRVTSATTVGKDAVSYTPTAADRALVKATGVPLYGASTTYEERDGLLYVTFQGYVPEDRAAAEQAMTGDPPMTYIKQMFQMVPIQKQLEGQNAGTAFSWAFRRGFSIGTNSYTMQKNWEGLDNYGKLGALAGYLDANAKNLTPEQYDYYNNVLNDLYNKMAARQSAFAAWGVVGALAPKATPLGWAETIASYGLSSWSGFDNNFNLDALRVEINTLALKNEAAKLKLQEDDAMKKVEAALKQNEETRNRLLLAKPTWLKDPSGYTYEGVPSNRLTGVTATLLREDPATGTWLLWDAPAYGQTNPQVTDSEGRYAWFVPDGNYRVAYEKDGYQDASSVGMAVPPPRFDVNVGLVSMQSPAVTVVIPGAGGSSLVIDFTQYMQAEALTGVNITVAQGGTAVPGTVAPVHTEDTPGGIPMALSARFTPTAALSAGQEYTVSISRTVRNYAGRIMAEDYTQAVTIPAAASPPVLNDFTPDAGPAGMSVTISGSGFTDATAVQFGANPAPSFTVVSDSLIKATVPAGSGSVPLTVTNAGGPGPAPALFSYTAAAPVVSGISPSKGPGTGDTLVTIRGSGFSGVTAVNFGFLQGTGVTVNSDSKITVRTPIGTGTVPVTVTTPAGTSPVSTSVFNYRTSQSVPLDADGGQISTPDGNITLVIPAGALAGSQIVGVTNLDAAELPAPIPARDRIVGALAHVDIGPSRLAAPAGLTLAYNPSLVPAGYSVQIFKYGSWLPLSTTVGPLTVASEITASGYYAVLAVPPATSGGGGDGGNGGGGSIGGVPNPGPKSVSRLAGANRFQTAKAIAEQISSETVQDVFLATGYNFPDALCASILAKKLNAPILLADRTVEGSADALQYLRDHLSKDGTVHLLGGTGVISEEFIAELNRMGYRNVERIGGADRFATNLLLNRKLNAAVNIPVVIATADNFPDVLSMASIAAYKGWPVLLTGSAGLTPEALNFLKDQQPAQVYLIGGTGVLPENISAQVQAASARSQMKRLAGADRYVTAAQILENFTFTDPLHPQESTSYPQNIYLANGNDFPDALTGGVLAGLKGDMLVLIDSNKKTLPPAIEAYLKKIVNAKIKPNIVILGGTGVVPEDNVQQINKLFSGLNQ